MNTVTTKQHIAILGWLHLACGLLFAAIGLFAFPVGTAIGVYAIWVLTNEAAVEHFESPARLQKAGRQFGHP